MFNNSLIHNSHRNHTNRIFYENIFRSIIWSLHPTGRIVQINLHLRRFLSVSDTGCSGNKITVTSTLKFWNIYLVVGLIFRVLGVVQVAFDHHLIYHVHFTKQRVILFLPIFDTQSYPCPCQISLTLYIFCFFHVAYITIRWHGM